MHLTPAFLEENYILDPAKSSPQPESSLSQGLNFRGTAPTDFGQTLARAVFSMALRIWLPVSSGWMGQCSSD